MYLFILYHSPQAVKYCEKMSKIEINNVYKIFGSNPKSVLPMVKEGSSKEEILEKTGHTVGLDNVSMKIEEGEIFVCMGLSGSGKSTLANGLSVKLLLKSVDLFLKLLDRAQLQ